MAGSESNNRIIIIGGGVAGLTAGIYAQRCGFQSTIFESHTRPGGVCTSWKRGHYTFDAGIRMIIGITPPNPFYYFLREVGVIPSVKFSKIKQHHCIEDEKGQQLRLHQNIDDLENSLLDVAPQDGENIKRFLDILEDFSRFRPNLEIEPDAFKLKDGIRSLIAFGPVAHHFIKYWKIPLRHWLSSFKSSSLRDAFTKFYPIEDFPALAMFTSLGWFIGGHVGKPVQGSIGLVNAITDTYNRLGGELCCGQRVEKIIVNSGRATGVRLADGSEHMARVVISAADGYKTIFNMLNGQYINDTVRGYYRNIPVFNPLIMVNFGMHQEMKDEPDSIHFPIRREFSIFNRSIKNLNIHQISCNRWFAPAGHCVIRVGIETDYEPWARLALRPDRYKMEKERIADEVLDRLEERYPGLARCVKARDVATPITTERYTSNWKGAYEGWQPTTKTFGLRMKRTLPGLKNFYMTGQWVEPGGGVPGVLFSSRSTMRIICKHLKRRFIPGV